MKILKFWWTSMWNSDIITKSAKIACNQKTDIIVVVSAVFWVTNLLEELCQLSKKWNFKNTISKFNKLKKIHKDILSNILLDIVWEKTVTQIRKDKFKLHFDDLLIILEWISLLKDLSEKYQAKIMYYGEIFSSLLMIEAIKKIWHSSQQILSTNLIKTNTNYLDADVDLAKSKKASKLYFQKIDLHKNIPIVTWFAGSDSEKNINLLWRWWSDYVATLLWNFLDADAVEIRTDVDGVCSTDPRLISSVKILDTIDYRISVELALAGAKVLHQKTIWPLSKKNINIRVKNTFNQNAKWTLITNSAKN